MRTLLPTSHVPRPRQAALYLSGVTMVSIGAVLGLRSGLGGSPYDALLVTLSDRTGLGVVAVAWLLQAMWAAAAMRMGHRPTPGAIGHSLLFGPMIAAGLGLVPEAASLPVGALYLAGSVAGLACGLHLYLSASYLSGILDRFFAAAGTRFRVSDTALRRVFDAGCVAYAWIGEGPVGPGTVIIALGVGSVLRRIRRDAPTPRSWRGIGLSVEDSSGGFADQARRYAEARRDRYVADPSAGARR